MAVRKGATSKEGKRAAQAAETAANEAAAAAPKGEELKREREAILLGIDPFGHGLTQSEWNSLSEADRTVLSGSVPPAKKAPIGMRAETRGSHPALLVQDLTNRQAAAAAKTAAAKAKKVAARAAKKARKAEAAAKKAIKAAKKSVFSKAKPEVKAKAKAAAKKAGKAAVKAKAAAKAVKKAAKKINTTAKKLKKKAAAAPSAPSTAPAPAKAGGKKGGRKLKAKGSSKGRKGKAKSKGKRAAARRPASSSKRKGDRVMVKRDKGGRRVKRVSVVLKNPSMGSIKAAVKQTVTTAIPALAGGALMGLIDAKVLAGRQIGLRILGKLTAAGIAMALMRKYPRSAATMAGAMLGTLGYELLTRFAGGFVATSKEEVKKELGALVREDPYAMQGLINAAGMSYPQYPSLQGGQQYFPDEVHTG